MFGLALSRHLIQGPVIRSWNSITGFANLLWCKLNHSRNSNMPRSRRRYHSPSRSRSRSHSYDRDRDLKRRRIDSNEILPYPIPISPESCVEDTENEESNVDSSMEHERCITKSLSAPNEHLMLMDCKVMLTDCANLVNDYVTVIENDSCEHGNVELNSSIDSEIEECNKPKSSRSVTLSTNVFKKSLTPKQLERQKLRDAKLAELELKKQKVLDEKSRILQEKLKLKNDKEKERSDKQKIKQEKDEQKLKEKQERLILKQQELEEKQKEKELKDEKKKKELEEKEQKRKEKEQKEEQKRKELEGKQKEKQKQAEKKQKVAAKFVNFFIRKSDTVVEGKKCDNAKNMSFMPFKVKADMRLAPLCRKTLTEAEKSDLTNNLQNDTTTLYLDDLKSKKVVGKSGKTWPFDTLENDDVILVEDTNITKSVEDIPKTRKMRAKFFKFEENRRPAYFGTWQKKSAIVRPRNPLGLDKKFFDYLVDSDDEWEEEDPAGESLCDSDDEDKENDVENEYEVDDEFFVPHGYLSDDEMNDEEIVVVSPESLKTKLKLLKEEFDEERKDQTHRIKPRVIGCFWEKRLQDIEGAYELLKPFSIISNGPVMIKKRSELSPCVPIRKNTVHGKPLSVELIPSLLKTVHGNTNNMKSIINGFLCDLSNKGINTEVSKNSLRNELKNFAEWIRYPGDGPMHNKFCWYVHKEMQEKYNVDFSFLS